jgi:hypothetical protein
VINSWGNFCRCGSAHVCSVGPNFVLLDVVERSLEPHTLQRVIVIFEEELERAGGDPDFRVFHREGGFWACPETFWEDLYREFELRKSRKSVGERWVTRLTVAR